MGEREDERPVSVPDDDEEREPLFPIKGYIFLNLFFWAFCAGEVLLIKWWLKDIRGVVFFFSLLAVGFTVVSIYDCIYDRLTARPAPREGAAGTSTS